MSALVAIALVVCGVLVWLAGVMVTQILTREVDWWATRLEALFARIAAAIAPRKHHRRTLRDTWLAELAAEREPGETRVLMAMSFVVASVRMRRRPRVDGDTLVVEVHAADGATVTDSVVVIDTPAAIHGTGELTAKVIRAGSTAAGVGGMAAHGTVRVSGSVGLGGELTGHDQGGGSTVLGFHSDVMDRLATGDYPAVDMRRLLG